MSANPIRPGPAIAAVLLFNPMLGSLYAWSVFLTPLETELGVPRAEISIVFSVAIFCFTAGAVAAPATYNHVRTALLPVVATVFCAGGLGVAALAETSALLTFGYGALFGFGSGFGYNVTLPLINRALAHRRGLANGLALGAFPVGAIGFSFLFGSYVETIGPRSIFGLTALFLVVGGLAAAGLASRSGIRLDSDTGGAAETVPPAPRALFPLLWLGFFLAAAGGVMVIGHAAGILSSRGGGALVATIGAVFVNIGNAGGRFGAGWACDFLPPGRVAMTAHLAALVGFLVLILLPGIVPAVVAVAFVGLSYGIASGAYPSAVSIYFGVARYGRNFGILITAWGIAGLSGPWLGGWLFDRSGDYVLAAIIGAVLAAIGVLVCLGIRVGKPVSPLSE